jgi:hypothetical protein
MPKANPPPHRDQRGGIIERRKLISASRECVEIQWVKTENTRVYWRPSTLKKKKERRERRDVGGERELWWSGRRWMTQHCGDFQGLNFLGLGLVVIDVWICCDSDDDVVLKGSLNTDSIYADNQNEESMNRSCIQQMFRLRYTRSLCSSTIQHTFVQQRPLPASFIVQGTRIMATPSDPAVSNATTSQEPKSFPTLRFADVSTTTHFLAKS